MHFEVRRHIRATPARAWACLTDAQRLVTGNLGITRLEGRIAAGEKLKLWSEAAPGRAFPLKVTAFDAPRSMRWEGGMPFGLFKGVRQFNLEPHDGGVLFHMREDYSGPLLGLIGKSLPDLTPSFEKFAAGLAALAEAEHRGDRQ
jgi:hypothetical protein